MRKKTGKQTVIFSDNVYVAGHANIAGKKEGQGPLSKYYNHTSYIIIQNFLFHKDRCFFYKMW